MVIMRTMDVFYAFPSILLAIAICGMLGNGIDEFHPGARRGVHSANGADQRDGHHPGAQSISWKPRALPAPPRCMIRNHVLANVLGPILVYATSLISVSIILSAGLSFLGLGVTPPQAEWGLMLNSLRQAIYVQPMSPRCRA